MRVCFCGIILLITLTPARAQVSDLIRQSNEARIADLHHLVGKIGNDTTLLFKTYDSLTLVAGNAKDDLFLWHIQLHQTLSQMVYRYSNPQARLNYIKSTQTHFEESPFKVIKGAYYLYLSNAYFQHVDFKESFKYALRSEQIFQQAGYENIPEAVIYLDRLFGFYYYFEDYKTAVKYAELSLKHNRYTLIKTTFLRNNLGLAYLKMQDYTNASKNFLLCIAEAKERKDTVYVGIASGNYGNTLRLQRKYKEALPYLYTDVILNKKAVPENSAITCLYIAYSLLQSDSLAKAKTYIDLSLQLQPNWLWTSFGLNYYEAQGLYYQKMKNYPMSIQYRDSTVLLKDSIRKVFDNRLLTGAEAQIAAEKYLNNLQIVEAERNNAVWRRNIAIATIFIIAFALIYSLKQRSDKEKAEKKNAQERLLHATVQLEQYLDNIKGKNELIEKMSAELEQRKLNTQDTTLLETHLDTLYKSVLLTEDDWQKFKQIFDQVHPHFFVHLKEIYKDISPAEIRLLTLQKLNVSSKEMAFMLGISTESLRKARYRLRKKLESLQAPTDFQDLV